MYPHRSVAFVFVVVGLVGAASRNCSARSPAQEPVALEQLSPDSFAEFIEGAIARFKTIQLDIHYTSTEVGKSAPFNRESGTWWWRWDGLERLRLVRSVDGKQVVLQYTRSPEKEVSFSEANDDIAIQPPSFFGMTDQWGMPKTIFCLTEIIFYKSQILQTLRIHGWEVVNQRRCLKVSFHPYQLTDGSVNRSVEYRYWLDIERNCHPLQREVIDKGKRIFLTRIDLHQVHEDLWFPIRGHVAGTETLAEVVVVPESLQVNPILEDADLEIAVPSGVFVNNKLTGEQYYQGGRPRSRAPVPTEPELDEAVDKANEQQEAIRVTSLARSKNTGLYWFFAGVSLALVVVGVALVLRGRGVRGG